MELQDVEHQPLYTVRDDSSSKTTTEQAYSFVKLKRAGQKHHTNNSVFAHNLHNRLPV